MTVDEAGPSAHSSEGIQASTSEEVVNSVLQDESREPEASVNDNVADASLPLQHTSAVPPNSSSNGQSSRNLLTHISQLSEDALRASNEKVSVAQHAYDLVSVSHLLTSFTACWNRDAGRSIYSRP